MQNYFDIAEHTDLVGSLVGNRMKLVGTIGTGCAGCTDRGSLVVGRVHNRDSLVKKRMLSMTSTISMLE